MGARRYRQRIRKSASLTLMSSTRSYVNMKYPMRRGRQPCWHAILSPLLDLHRFCSGQVLMLGGPLFEGHG
jgi:hypothetical protein